MAAKEHLFFDSQERDDNETVYNVSSAQNSVVPQSGFTTQREESKQVPGQRYDTAHLYQQTSREQGNTNFKIQTQTVTARKNEDPILNKTSNLLGIDRLIEDIDTYLDSPAGSHNP